ncbi:hypothetical protein KI387_020580, partial [Taxus chinensis]
ELGSGHGVNGLQRSNIRDRALGFGSELSILQEDASRVYDAVDKKIRGKKSKFNFLDEFCLKFLVSCEVNGPNYVDVQTPPLCGIPEEKFVGIPYESNGGIGDPYKKR